MKRPVRLSTRALILRNQRLLLVNAWPKGVSDLWCAPGGGVMPHSSLPENLAREVREETGLAITVGAPVLINEFHAPERDFHQIDVYFRCAPNGHMPESWTDPAGIVTERRFFSRSELATVRYKPDSLPDAAWGGGSMLYDPLELLVR